MRFDNVFKAPGKIRYTCLFISEYLHLLDKQINIICFSNNYTQLSYVIVIRESVCIQFYIERRKIACTGS